jgi:hypothetical protein
MRFPVFARRSNPAFDQPIVRKSKSYVTDQVEHGVAEWIDALDRSKGIICREMLYFGPRAFPSLSTAIVLEDRGSETPIELPGLHMEFPKSCAGESMASVRANWDWNWQWSRQERQAC